MTPQKREATCEGCMDECDGSCGEECEKGCASSCANVCQGTCGNGCDNTCDDTCDNTCLTGCEGNCKNICYSICTSTCRDGCEGNCYNECNKSCYLACFGTCYKACNDTCYTGCLDNCKADCEITCNTSCEDGCLNSCKNNCQNYCSFDGQTYCDYEQIYSKNDGLNAPEGAGESFDWSNPVASGKELVITANDWNDLRARIELAYEVCDDSMSALTGLDVAKGQAISAKVYNNIANALEIEEVDNILKPVPISANIINALKDAYNSLKINEGIPSEGENSCCQKSQACMTANELAKIQTCLDQTVSGCSNQTSYGCGSQTTDTRCGGQTISPKPD